MAGRSKGSAGSNVPTQLSEQCPSFCVCDTWYDLVRVSCTGRHLYGIHTGAPGNVQALDLSDNVISILNDFDLADEGLTKLKYINLSGNAISEIGLNAFDRLTDLKIVDLSRNRLHSILDDVFVRSKNLQILKLSRNNFNAHVPKLKNHWLQVLNLDSCQISHLTADTFSGIPHVRHLDLSYNLMIQMDYTVVQTLPALKTLSLAGNPWSCNSVIHNFQLYLQYKRIKFNGICGKKAKPQKFEKMIILPTFKRQNYHRSVIANTTTEKTDSVQYDVLSTSSNKNLSITEQSIIQPTVFHSVNRNLQYWFLCIGFISGISSGLMISYIWLSGKFCCKQRRRRSLNSYIGVQIDTDESLIESYRDTPPPSYKDVVRHPGLYHYL
ncbi:uncharacterized protein LOC143426192 isoform X2 [Xylocopa sonorina]|uniref:uncharacterized protein LOC143426192 isoform X2 n=1 Tax=Xylocopa sonorina TaxID=1818115 RepID=UPI00403AAB00